MRLAPLVVLLLLAAPAFSGTTAAGHQHTCVIRDGALRCKGGATGKTALDDVVSIDSDLGATCVLRQGGQVQCFGRNAPPTPKGLRFRQVAMGTHLLCGVRRNQRLHCTSRGADGPRLTQQAKTLGKLREVAGGGRNVCVVDAKHRVRCLRGPLKGAEGNAPLHHLDVGPQFACGLHADDGRVLCFGARAIDLTLPLGQMQKVVVGDQHVVALDVTGRLHVFALEDIAGIVSGAPQGAFVDVVAGSAHACAIREDGQAICWGRVPHASTFKLSAPKRQ